jgi:DNA-binding SARP family transcriptional activator
MRSSFLGAALLSSVISNIPRHLFQEEHSVYPIPRLAERVLDMSKLQFRLFGKFAASDGRRTLKGLDAAKDQELISYLLIHRNQHHSRETLAGLLWSENSTERSKKYLRQAIWHLQSVLEPDTSSGEKVVLAEHDWLRLNPENRPWCDVAEFEEAFLRTEGIAGNQLDEERALGLKQAVALYRDDLLAGWYHDWILFERERLQNKYLIMLDKLLRYSSVHREFEAGQSYAEAILRHDPAQERTHRQLMRLHYAAGDRTAALRQYDRCVVALQEELGVAPEKRTISLYEKIKTEQTEQADSAENNLSLAFHEPAAGPDIVSHLKLLQRILGAVQRRIQRDITAFEASKPKRKIID